MRKKNLLFSAVCVTMVSIVGISGILLTNSKYTQTVEGEATTNVAKWVFNVSGSDSYATSDTIQSIKLAETCTPATLVNGNIAPGTSGHFDIVIDTSGAEVGMNYEISFTNLPANFPKNLVFTVDDQVYNLANGFSGNIPASTSKAGNTITKTVNWEWLYEAENEASIAAEDLEDTTDGMAAAKNLTFDITVKGTQVKPVHKN